LTPLVGTVTPPLVPLAVAVELASPVLVAVPDAPPVAVGAPVVVAGGIEPDKDVSIFVLSIGYPSVSPSLSPSCVESFNSEQRCSRISQP
jgi:hypothetical protein